MGRLGYAAHVLPVVLALTAVACDDEPLTRDAEAPAGVSYTWTESARPGSGVYPEEWTPGKWPTTLLPVQAFGGKLWMTAQAFAWSSANGVSWERHLKADWGERISHSIVFFAGKLWMFGGMKLPDS